MSAAICLAGHIVENINAYKLHECLLKLPLSDVFKMMSADLERLKGCYLLFDAMKGILIWSGKAPGNELRSNFQGCGKTHVEN